MSDAEALARIDAALTEQTAISAIMALRVARAEIVRLSALIPEPPTDDEPSREEYREGYEAWRTEGRRMHAALLDIWRMAEPTDTSHLTYGDDPAVVVAAVRALFTPTDDEREALARRLLAIDYACAPRQVAHHQRENSEAWRQALVSAGDLMASPEWRNRHRGPITDEVVGRSVVAYRDARNGFGHMNSDVHFRCMRAAIEAAEAAR